MRTLRWAVVAVAVTGAAVFWESAVEVAQFPAEYRNDAFVAMRGSWNREPPTGYKVVRIRFKGGRPTGFDDCLHSFLIEGAARTSGGWPASPSPGTALLVSDDANGVIYRVTYVSRGDGPIRSAAVL